MERTMKILMNGSKYFIANNWAANRKVQIAAGYLKDAALDWYTADATNIVQWHQNGQNDNFDDRFIAYFLLKLNKINGTMN